MNTVFLPLALLLAAGTTQSGLVRSVRVRGNLRVPSAAILNMVSAKPGAALDESRLRADVERLWRWKQFEQVEVTKTPGEPEGVDVVFHVRERPLLTKVEFVGLPEGQETRLREMLAKENIDLRGGRALDPAELARAAAFTRRVFQARKHLRAQVETATEEKGTSAKVVISVTPGPKIPVTSVRFEGNDAVSDGELLSRMEATRPVPWWAPWRSGGRLVGEELTSDLQRAQQRYRSAGFAAAKLGPAQVRVREEAGRRAPLFISINENKSRLAVEIVVPVAEGLRYSFGEVRWEGEAGLASDEVRALIEKVQAGTLYDGSLLEDTRQAVIRALSDRSYALAAVSLEESPDPSAKTVNAVFRVRAGNPMSIGRIRFEGNLHIPDRFLRRELEIEEGRDFSGSDLDDSIERLNRCGLLKELVRSDVELEADERLNSVDLTFKVREKDRQGIYATGGRNELGGYLGGLYTAFNLLGLGEILSVQLDGGAAQSNFLLNLAMGRFLGSPFSVALSAFHRVTGLNVASVVPGPEDVASLLRHRSTGVALGAAYPIRTRAHIGSSLRLERTDLTGWSGDSADPGAESHEHRVVLSPTFVFDSTRGEGAGLRGTRIAVAHSWTAAPGVGPLQSVADGFRVSRAAPDPWTGGRNSVFFKFQGGSIRPRPGVELAADQRYYPGGELARGFGQGGLSPWGDRSGDSALEIEPAGADAFAGFSMEYRTPVRGALSGAGFLDLGWTRLGKGGARGLGGALIEPTNRVLRASTGAELRLQLPLIRQPARLIFAWNPLRLDKVVSAPAGALRVADPGHAIRFAFGEFF